MEKKLHVIRKYSIDELYDLLEIPENEEIIDVETEINKDLEVISFEVITEVRK